MTFPFGDSNASGEDVDNPQVLHATSVALGDRGALIRGSSGSGKSSLALQLIALGASLIADDRTIVCRSFDGVSLMAPDILKGKIEARGVGILPAPTTSRAKLTLIVEMDRAEDDRLPPWRQASLLGHSVPVLRKLDAAHFPAAVLLYLQHGRVD
ncbi:serine kinase [uncultured Roseovarius sp.]|uniref:HPr kinase/phosphorylase n=1 Tax=uncultured Roseovarius sp. TaxID=293344 RepID=UPI0025D3DED0|nr:serine kinase [uncultured Roseovarius sp.]